MGRWILQSSDGQTVKLSTPLCGEHTQICTPFSVSADEDTVKLLVVLLTGLLIVLLIFIDCFNDYYFIILKVFLLFRAC